MNVTVINAKEILKVVIKIGTIIFFIYISIHFYNTLRGLKQDTIKEQIETNVSKINRHSFLECLDISIPLMSYQKQESIQYTMLSSDNILTMGATILNESLLKNTDLVSQKEENISQEKEEKNKIEELPENIKTEVVEENNIKVHYTTLYQSVQIDNQSNYTLTEDMLVPDVEIDNKKDIVIYHTHTCESYTSSQRL